MTTQRLLDDIEASATSTSAPIVISAEYEGDFDQAALARAFEVLCANHPVLRGNIRENDRGYLLRVPSNYQPELLVRDGGEPAYLIEVGMPSDSERCVAQLSLICGEDDRGYVVQRIDHAIADGRGGVALFDELWRHYTDIVNGSDISVGPGLKLPSPPSDLLTQRLGRNLPARPPHPLAVELPGGSEAVRQHIRLTAEDTSLLFAAARANDISVHPLVCGAILVAQRAQQSPMLMRTPMVCWSAVDLRGRVNPPVGATETTTFVGGHRAEVTVTENGNPVAIGREIRAQLDAAIARHELLVHPQVVRALSHEASLEQRLAFAIVTNLGVIPRLTQPADLSVTDLRVTRLGSEIHPFYRVYTYEGRLSIDFAYPSDSYTIDQAEQLVEQVTAQLRHISTSRPT